MMVRNLRGIHVLRVRGDAADRSRAHAALLKKVIHQGAFIALSRKNEGLIRRAPGALQVPWIQNLGVQFYRQILSRLFRGALTSEDRASLHAISEELNLPLRQCEETFYQPDVLMFLARNSLTQYFLPDWYPDGVPGCTSGVALKARTQNKKLLAARNMDYVVVGPWESHPTLVFNEPSGPGEINYVSVTTAGVQTGGLTSMNEEGLTLATHAHFGNKVKFRGRLVASLGDEVIRKSKSIGQAIDLVRKNLPCANWAFVLSSAKEDRAVVLEMTPDRLQVREAADGRIAHSNYFHTPELQKREALFCGGYCQDLQARWKRMLQILDQHQGSLTPGHLAQALGDRYDCLSGVERIFGSTLAVVTTVKSVVFEPESKRLWMANRHESPVSLGDFLEIQTDRFWKESQEEYESKMEVLPGNIPQNPEAISAIREYREAYRAMHMEGHQAEFKVRALSHVIRAIQFFPDDGNLWIQAGLISFQLGKIADAKNYFMESRLRKVTEHSAQVSDLYLARCFDLVGDRNEARRIYLKWNQVSEPKLRAAYRKGLKRSYKYKNILTVLADLQFPDTFQY